MMQLPKKITDYNAFIDGVSYAGRITEAKMPDLTIMTAAHRGAGMDGSVAVDVGMEAMKSELTSMEWTPALVKLFGTRQQLVLRPVEKASDGGIVGWVVTMQGLWGGLSGSNLKPGDDMPLKLVQELTAIKIERAGEVLIDIDLTASKRIVGKTDQLAAKRAAMGL